MEPTQNQANVCCDHSIPYPPWPALKTSVAMTACNVLDPSYICKSGKPYSWHQGMPYSLAKGNGEDAFENSHGFRYNTSDDGAELVRLQQQQSSFTNASHGAPSKINRSLGSIADGEVTSGRRRDSIRLFLVQPHLRAMFCSMLKQQIPGSR